MEGHSSTYFSAVNEQFVLNYYCALSDEKRQDGGTTAENLRRLLTDLLIARKELLWGTLKRLISVCDGCSAVGLFATS